MPKILVAGGGGGGDGHAGNGGGGGGMSGNILEALLAMLLSDKVGADLGGGVTAGSLPRNATADALRRRIQHDIDTPKGG